MAKTANLALRISPEVKEALESAAKAEHRSVSSYVEIALTRHLEIKGLLKLDENFAEARLAS